MKILILGHKGMLGHMVHKYLSTKNDCELVTTDLRWSTTEFKNFVKDFCWGQNGDYIVNCIGAIHQRTTEFDVNIDLPIWLDKNVFRKCKIIHPGTDCEIDDDDYGTSKRKAAEYLKEKGKTTKTINTSIIGTELNTKASLLEWFLSEDSEVYGYTKAKWNGVTTLQWAKQCYSLISNWDDYNTETILYSDSVSKFELLNTIKTVFNKKIKVIEKKLGKDKCLDGDLYTRNIKEQLIELKEFYYDN